MAGLDPKVSFTPAVTEAFGANQVLVVKDAHSGQSIRSWCKSNHKFPPPTTGPVPKVRAQLYEPLIKKVKTAIEGQSLDKTSHARGITSNKVSEFFTIKNDAATLLASRYFKGAEQPDFIRIKAKRAPNSLPKSKSPVIIRFEFHTGRSEKGLIASV